MALLRRVLAFAGLPFISLTIPFLFLPLLARIAGGEAWLAIAVGQSVGAFAALVVSLGYNTVGPTIVARAAVEERATVLAASIRPRLLLFLPAVIVASAVSAVIAPDPHRIDAALMAIALTLGGLSSTWYMVGLGRAILIVGYELVPRLLATVAAAVLLLLAGEVIWYPALLIGATVIGSGSFLVRTVGREGFLTRGPGAVRRQLMANRTVLATEIAAGAHNSLAVSFVSLVSPVAAAAAYISGDKLYRIGQYSVSALGNAVQGWVVDDQGREFRTRARIALLAHGALGVAGLVAFTALGPPLSRWLFGEIVAIDTPTAVGFGVATLGIALGTGIGRVVLIALDARRSFMVSVIAGAVTGISAILILGSQFGAAGGAWGLAIGELVSVACQSIVATRLLRRKASPREVID